jgi:hypothetical protein
MTGKNKAVLSRKGNVTRGRGNARQIYGFLVWRGGSDPSSRFTSEEGGRTNKILPRAWLPDLGSPDKTSMLEIYSIRPSRPLREVIHSLGGCISSSDGTLLVSGGATRVRVVHLRLLLHPPRGRLIWLRQLYMRGSVDPSQCQGTHGLPRDHSELHCFVYRQQKVVHHHTLCTK